MRYAIVTARVTVQYWLMAIVGYAAIISTMLLGFIPWKDDLDDSSSDVQPSRHWTPKVIEGGKNGVP